MSFSSTISKFLSLSYSQYLLIICIISWSCCNKVPPMGWLKTTHVSSLRVLEARGPTSEVQAGLRPLGALSGFWSCAPHSPWLPGPSSVFQTWSTASYSLPSSLQQHLPLPPSSKVTCDSGPTRTTQDNLPVSGSLTYSKSPFPYKVSCTGSRH